MSASIQEKGPVLIGDPFQTYEEFMSGGKKALEKSSFFRRLWDGLTLDVTHHTVESAKDVYLVGPHEPKQLNIGRRRWSFPDLSYPLPSEFLLLPRSL